MYVSMSCKKHTGFNGDVYMTNEVGYIEIADRRMHNRT